MSHTDFIAAFSEAQGLSSVDSLLSEYAERYSFQINSRNRAKDAISKLEEFLTIDWRGKKILDVGCAYGAFTIELANRGALPVGIELSEKWLKLASINSSNEADIPFIKCDAASRSAVKLLSSFAPFDVVFVNDVFEHIYDTPALLDNLKNLMAPGGFLYFKVPNGMATRHVLLEGHKRKFGISLLAPDYWSKFVSNPFHIYYRRWEYFAGLFKEFGFTNMSLLNIKHDLDLGITKKHIQKDLYRIKQHLLQESNFDNPDQLAVLKNACHLYFNEVEEDLELMDWDGLFFKYRTNFWEGIIFAPSGLPL